MSSRAKGSKRIKISNLLPFWKDLGNCERSTRTYQNSSGSSCTFAIFVCFISFHQMLQSENTICMKHQDSFSVFLQGMYSTHQYIMLSTSKQVSARQGCFQNICVTQKSHICYLSGTPWSSSGRLCTSDRSSHHIRLPQCVTPHCICFCQDLMHITK